MTITQLKYVLAVAQYQNFTKAAEKVFVTQPTLSMQIQKLEQGYRSDIDASLKEAQKKNQQYQAEAETVTREENEKRAMELQEMEQSIREYQQTASQEIQKKQEGNPYLH